MHLLRKTAPLLGLATLAFGLRGSVLAAAAGYTYTTLNDPSAIDDTIAAGINDAGQVVGTYDNATGTHGFLESGSIYTTLNDPNATDGTFAVGINNAGKIVGYYYDATGHGDHGFLETGGVYTTLNNPSITGGTEAYGINNNDQIVGAYGDGGSSYGFLETGGVYTPLNDPSAIYGTIAEGVNDAGWVVGYYNVTNGASGAHGFLATPDASPVPEASTTVSFGLLLALGLGATVIAAKRKKGRAAE